MCRLSPQTIACWGTRVSLAPKNKMTTLSVCNNTLNQLLSVSCCFTLNMSFPVSSVLFSFYKGRNTDDIRSESGTANLSVVSVSSVSSETYGGSKRQVCRVSRGEHVSREVFICVTHFD